MKNIRNKTDVLVMKANAFNRALICLAEEAIHDGVPPSVVIGALSSTLHGLHHRYSLQFHKSVVEDLYEQRRDL